MEYESYVFNNLPRWESVPAAAIASWHWEGAEPFRPPSFAQLCGVAGKGLYARLWSFEANPRCVCDKRDDPVYTDSCLELFLQPVPGNEAYVNFEMNCSGVTLSQFGKMRQGRVFLKDFCALEPQVLPFTTVKNGQTAWGVELFLSDSLISGIYGIDYITKPCTLRGNFYKCGDKTPCAHYGAYFPAGSAMLGFHNPSRFGRIILK